MDIDLIRDLITSFIVVWLMLTVRGVWLYVFAGVLFMFAMYHTFSTLAFITFVWVAIIESFKFAFKRLAHNYGAVIGKPLTVD